mmetsp:Transcript_2511/g.8296  ORF Transcript_2511/g.8296 Transcript_2511/m.8296 type:complete len:267 (+) Transcript_2511:1761-2561(+)
MVQRLSKFARVARCFDALLLGYLQMPLKCLQLIFSVFSLGFCFLSCSAISRSLRRQCCELLSQTCGFNALRFSALHLGVIRTQRLLQVCHLFIALTNNLAQLCRLFIVSTQVALIFVQFPLVFATFFFPSFINFPFLFLGVFIFFILQIQQVRPKLFELLVHLAVLNSQLLEFTRHRIHGRRRPRSVHATKLFRLTQRLCCRQQPSLEFAHVPICIIRLRHRRYNGCSFFLLARSRREYGILNASLYFRFRRRSASSFKVVLLTQR